MKRYCSKFWLLGGEGDTRTGHGIKILPKLSYQAGLLLGLVFVVDILGCKGGFSCLVGEQGVPCPTVLIFLALSAH